MRLIQCHVENFGKLHGLDYRFEDGMNCILEKNGWGKTTFAAFLKAMLYGMDGHARRKIAENERKRYLPWQGGAYGGNLVFQSGGKEYRVERFFGARAKEDTVCLYDNQTGLVISKDPASIGEELLGMDGEAFSASLYSLQKQMESSMNDSLSARLTGNGSAPQGSSAFLANFGENDRFEEARKILADQIRLYQKTGNRGKLAQLEQELWTERVKLEKLSRETSRSEEDEAAQREQRELERCFENGEPDAKEMETVRHQYEAWKETSVTIQNLEEQLHREAESRSKKTLDAATKMQIAGGAVALAGAVAALVQTAAGIAVFLAGVLLMLFGLIRTLRSGGHDGGRQEQKTRQMEKEREKLQQRQHQLEEAMRRFFAPYVPDFQPEACMDAILSLNEKKYRLQFLRKEQEKREAQAEAQNMLRRREQEDLAASIRRKQEELERGKEALRILQLTGTYLEEARTRMAAGYQVRVNESFRRYLGHLGMEQAEAASLDIQLRIRVQESGAGKELAYYSVGCQDRMNLGVRLALAESLFPQEKPFLILDDPFANQDEDGIRMGRQLLQEFAKEYQILYMTCHESRAIGSSR